MCFDFEWEYHRQAAEQARKAQEQRRQVQPAVPAKPAEADTAREQGEPVPV
ncbi:MAG TPA: hypothetical protein VML57_08575 [Burkholderiales bacterium]|nr:hypothetical protein [Burkholderiales bacterium]